MAEIRHYLTHEIYVRIRCPFKRARVLIEHMLESAEHEGCDIRFDKQKNVTVIYLDRDGRHSRVYAVVRTRENNRLLSFLNSLGY